MPTSEDFGKQQAIEWIRNRIDSRSVILDVGMGAGSWGKLIRRNLQDSYIIGIEIWEPYIEKYKLKSIYDELIVEDVRTVDFPPVDLIIFGDVLEHMSKQDAVRQWHKAALAADYVLMAMPVVHYPQGAYDNNPHEAHVYHWSVQDIHDTFGKPCKQLDNGRVGTFLYKNV